MRRLCWINGTWTFEPHVSAHDRGLLVADGLFETMRVENGALADFDAHFTRLSEGLEAFNLQVSCSKEELQVAANTLIEQVPELGNLGRLRLTVTRGVPGLEATVIMSLTPQKLPVRPLELILTDVIRIAGNPSSRYKTLSYTDNFFAQRQVEQVGENRIAVMCNQWGRVACASIGNLFVRVDSTWLTPAVSEGALPGITRGKLLKVGIYNGLPVKEGLVTKAQFLEGEVLLTNVLRGVEKGSAK